MDQDRIVNLPNVPQEIIDAVNNKHLAIFIGAGVSMLLECCSWEKLAQNLIDRCYLTQRKENPNLSCITFNSISVSKKMSGISQ